MCSGVIAGGGSRLRMGCEFVLLVVSWMSRWIGSFGESVGSFERKVLVFDFTLAISVSPHEYLIFDRQWSMKKHLNVSASTCVRWSWPEHNFNDMRASPCLCN